MFQQGFDTPLDAHKPGHVKPVEGDGNCLFRAPLGDSSAVMELHEFVQGENRAIQW